MKKTTLTLASALLVAALLPASATTARWTSNADGLWTTAANWSAAQYPGQDAANQGAYLTNRVDGTIYKATVNTALPYSVGVVEIRNAGTAGEAWVVVTNTVFSATNAMVRAGGRFEVDALGIVTNTAFTMDAANGQLIVGSGGRLHSITNIAVGSAANATNNTLTLGDNAVLTAVGGFTIGSNASASGNRLLVTGSNVTIRTTGTPTIGNGSSSSRAEFTGEGTVWDWGSTGQQGRVGQGGTNCVMIVSQGSLIITNHATFNIGYFTGAARDSLIVTNGGRLFTRRTVGAGSSAPSNTIHVTGQGSRWDNNGDRVIIGNDGGSFNRIIVDQGGTISNASVWVGSFNLGSRGNSLVIANGGRWFVGTGSGYTTTIGYFGTNNSAVVTGNDSLWDMGTRTLYVGQGTPGTCTNALASLRVEDGGVVTNGPVTVGGGATSIQNTLTVTNRGAIYAAAFTVGAANSSNNLATVAAGGLLQATSLVNGGVAAGNSIVNLGGVYQFTSATPTVTPGGAGGITLTDGTLSFRAINNANVLGNLSGTQLTNITCFGANTFRLNAATNVVSPDQSYTFAPGLGASHYARLELMNSARYRGGNVTIGNGGTLLVGNGTSAVGNLALQNNSALQVSLTPSAPTPLTVEGTLNLDGTLSVTLQGAPTDGSTYPVIRDTLAQGALGAFANTTAMGTYQGTNYVFDIRTSAAAGGGVELRYLAQRATMVLIR